MDKYKINKALQGK